MINTSKKWLPLASLLACFVGFNVNLVSCKTKDGDRNLVKGSAPSPKVKPLTKDAEELSAEDLVQSLTNLHIVDFPAGGASFIGTQHRPPHGYAYVRLSQKTAINIGRTPVAYIYKTNYKEENMNMLTVIKNEQTKSLGIIQPSILEVEFDTMIEERARISTNPKFHGQPQNITFKRIKVIKVPGSSSLAKDGEERAIKLKD